MRPECQCPALLDRCLSMVRAGLRFRCEVPFVMLVCCPSVNSCVESSTSAIWRGCSSRRLQPAFFGFNLYDTTILRQALQEPTSITSTTFSYTSYDASWPTLTLIGVLHPVPTRQTNYQQEDLTLCLSTSIFFTNGSPTNLYLLS